MDGMVDDNGRILSALHHPGHSLAAADRPVVGGCMHSIKSNKMLRDTRSQVVVSPATYEASEVHLTDKPRGKAHDIRQIHLGCLSSEVRK